MILQSLPDHPLAWHWRLAPMPQADLMLRRGGCLQGEAAQTLELGEPVVAAMRAAAAGGPGAMLAACDAEGRPWRLRRWTPDPALELWQVQPMALSRSRLFDSLRSALAAALAHHIAHQLRGPLQTLAFNADIAIRQLDPGGSSPRMSLEAIRRQVGRLRSIQESAVALWLGVPPAAPAAAASLRTVLEDALHLARQKLALEGVSLTAGDLSALDGCTVPGSGLMLQLALLAWLLLGGAAAKGAGNEPRPLGLRVLATPEPAIELGAGAAAAALGAPCSAWGDRAALAAVAVLLEAEGFDLFPEEGRSVVRRLQPVRQAA